MVNDKKNTITIDVNSEEPLEEKVAQWLKAYGSAVIYGGASVIGLLLLLFAWNHYTANADEKDYLQAEASYRTFSTLPSDQSSPATQPSFVELEAILEKRPELASRYNGLIAQNFLRLGDIPLALSYGQKALANLSDENLPFYEEYSKTSLLIADGKYPEALKRAEFLKKKMTESKKAPTERGFGDTLYTFNVLRIAELQQKLGNASAELAAWTEAAQLLSPNKETLSAQQGLRQHDSDAILATFKTGKVGLLDYIDARVKSLRQ